MTEKLRSRCRVLFLIYHLGKRPNTRWPIGQLTPDYVWHRRMVPIQRDLSLAGQAVAKDDQGAPPPRRRYDQLERDGDEDDAGLVEQAAIHDRDWDDWKDDHPRGAGNKANKRI